MGEAVPPILRDLPEELVGERVLVRPYRAGDGPALWEAVNEAPEHLRPWLPWVDSHAALADSEAFARRSGARWVLREELTTGVWERSSGRLLGGSGLHVRDWGVPWFEVGYWLRRSAEGQGFVTETVRLLLALAFDELGAQRVHIQCDAANVRSVAVARRLSFVPEGTLRNHRRDPDGVLSHTLLFALTPEDYRHVVDTENGSRPGNP